MMSQRLNRLIVLLCCISMVGCTTLHAIPVPALEGTGTPAPHFVPGDRWVVTTRAGTSAEMLVTAVTAQAVQGTSVEGQHAISIPREEIASVQRREFDAIKTAVLVGVIALAVYGYAVAKSASIINNMVCCP